MAIEPATTGLITLDPGFGNTGACRKAAPGGTFTLADVVRDFRPTVLVGASGQPVPRAEIERRVLAAMWRPEYLSYRVATDEEEPEPLTTPTARERTPGSARPS